MKKGVVLSAVILIVSLLLTACSANQPIANSESSDISETIPIESETPNEPEKPPQKTGIIAEQILNGNDGEIHYSYYLPEDYDESKTYPLVMTSITALKRHALPMTACKQLTVKMDIQMSKSANCWLSKFPTTNTLTAVEFTTTTAAISCLMMKRF